MTSVIIRQSVVREAGKKAYRDLEVDESEITIGSAAANIIRLAGEGVAPQHAVLVVMGGYAKLRALGKQHVVVNEKVVHRARLQEGDLLKFGMNVIEILRTPPGFDFAIQVESEGKPDDYHVQDSYVTHLQHTGLSRRWLAWSFAILVFALFITFGALRKGKGTSSQLLLTITGKQDEVCGGDLSEFTSTIAEAVGRLSVQRFDIEGGAIQYRIAVFPAGEDGIAKMVHALRQRLPTCDISYVNLEGLL